MKIEKAYVINIKDWRSWLVKNHKASKEIWLVYCKKHTLKKWILYNDAAVGKLYALDG